MIRSIKVIAFDVFGTVVDFSGVPREEVKDYASQLRRPEWEPLKLPASWEHLKAHPDSAEGIRRLRQHYIVCTCSNGPLGLLAKLSKNNGIVWDAIIPLEMNKVYKPNPQAYLTVCEVFGVETKDVLMVTANEMFGDIEAARALKMEASLIRHKDGPASIIELANELECCA